MFKRITSTSTTIATMENASESSDVSSKRRLKTPMHLLQDGGVYFLGSKIRIISKAKCRYVVVLVIMVVIVTMVIKVIVVTKANCRYEGVFYTFNKDDNTISLSSVRAFGTETREAERFVAPRDDEVYTYIVFNIDEINDIVILENMMMENLESTEDNETHKYRYRVPTIA